jgi:hypothetical protein
MKLVGDRTEFKTRIDFGFHAHQLPSLRKEIDHRLEIGHAPLGQIAAGIDSAAILSAFALSFCARGTFSHGIYTPPIYYSSENLVLWARSEIIGYAVKRADKNTEVRRQNSE